MFCSACGHSNAADSMSCSKCGSPLAIVAAPAGSGQVGSAVAPANVAGVDPSVPIKSTWVADDVGAAAPSHLKLMEKSVAGYSEGSFSVTRPDNGWPAGQYHLEIYIGDTLAKEVPFSIKQR